LRVATGAYCDFSPPFGFRISQALAANTGIQDGKHVEEKRNYSITGAIAGSILSLSLLSLTSHAQATSEKEAFAVAQEVKVMVSVGTGIIGGLQPEINAGNPDPATVEKNYLLQSFMDNYEASTGAAFDASADGLLGESRRQFLESYRAVLEDHEKVLAAGGTDSFVPADFRSELLAQFNERLGGRVKGYATNREADLLNPDWHIEALMDYSLFAFYVKELLEQQETSQLLERVAGRVVGYYPMTLEPSCVACHARQGLAQEVGAYGGALVTEVMLK